MIPLRHKNLWFALAAFWLWTAHVWAAAQPIEEVRSTVDQAIAVLKNPRLKTDERKRERRSQIRQVLIPRFDFAEMAKRSLGADWRRRTPEEQKEFVMLFTDLLENSYIDRIEAYNDEKFVYVREKRDEDFAQVDSKILTGKGEEFSITYKLHLVKGEWKVYDVVLENISLVNNYRSQFTRIITNASYEELVRRLREKAELMKSGK
jgi:phospholipid transport system substrate-binding protein